MEKLEYNLLSWLFTHYAFIYKQLNRSFNLHIKINSKLASVTIIYLKRNIKGDIEVNPISWTVYF